MTGKHELQAQIEALRSALEPFAAAWEECQRDIDSGVWEPNDDQGTAGLNIITKVGDWRKAFMAVRL